MGVGYDHISAILSDHWALSVIVLLLIFKWISWTVALGSGTSGGTLAPLFMMGGALGFLLGAGVVHILPDAGVNVRVAALVGTAALFAGASRAFLTSVVFAFETTLQPHGMLPLLIGCALAFWVSCLLMPDTIMTEKIARRGVSVPVDFQANPLERLTVGDANTCRPPVIRTGTTVIDAREQIDAAGQKHEGYAVLVSADEHLVGIVSIASIFRSDLDATSTVDRLPITPSATLKADHPLWVASRIILQSNPHAIILVDPQSPSTPVGLLTAEDILKAVTPRY